MVMCYVPISNESRTGWSVAIDEMLGILCTFIILAFIGYYLLRKFQIGWIGFSDTALLAYIIRNCHKAHVLTIQDMFKNCDCCKKWHATCGHRYAPKNVSMRSQTSWMQCRSLVQSAIYRRV